MQAALVGAVGFIAALATGLVGKDTSPLANQLHEAINKFDRKEAEKVCMQAYMYACIYIYYMYVCIVTCSYMCV